MLALAHDFAAHHQVGVQQRAPRALHAVHRPRPAVLREVRSVGRVPVLCVDDDGPRLDGRGDLRVRCRDDVLPSCDGQRPSRIGEVVLNVDDHECGFGVVSERHASSSCAVQAAVPGRRSRASSGRSARARAQCARAASTSSVAGNGRCRSRPPPPGARRRTSPPAVR